ncbi:MAG: FAD-dependent oxidoreductase [Proteobacteria bacterium]|nr:FAD-dependent oxidoreductase [Pseudomonadota bacterium]
MPDRQRPYWLAQALAADSSPAAPAVRGELRADLLVVGGGFTGLWTSILAKQQRPDLDVALIEADVCGAGASGRNGGCVLTWATKLPTLTRLFGAAEAARLVRASEAAIGEIEATVVAHRIACEWRRDGTLYTATSPAQVGASDAVMRALEAAGLSSWHRLPVDEVQRRAGSRTHLEGWYSPCAATVQPGMLVRGLRRVALELGVRLYEHTPLLALEAGSPAVIATPAGRVRADRVVLALNAWTARAFPSFRRSIVIVSSDMVVTAPDPAALAAAGLAGGTSVLDSRTFVHYYRSTADGRVMLGKGGNTFAYGGRIHPVFDRPSPYAADLARRLRAFLPEFAQTPIAASWNGPSDRSVTGLPFFGRLAANVSYGFGYSGNGVGPSRIGGRILASLALGLDDEWSRSPLAHGPRGQFPPEPARYLGALIVRGAIRRQERAEDAHRPVRAWDRALARLAASAGKADHSQ